MSVFSEIFSSELKLNMIDDNSFLSKFTDYSSWIIGKGQVLHIPNMDVVPVVTKGLIGDGAFTSSVSTETAQTITLERYQVAPYRVPLADELYTSYEKMTGLAKQITNKITDYIHTEILINAAKQVDTARNISTTGAAGSGNSPFGSNVKMVTIKDLFTVSKKMDQDKVSKSNRYIVMNPEMYHELMVGSDNISYNRYDYLGSQTFPTGVINQIAGINIMVRAEVPYGQGGVVSNQGTAAIAGDKYYAFAFQTDETAYALGSLNVLEETANVFKFADLISCENYMFAGSPRISGKRIGIYNLIQG
jgi:hypothetical protein